MTELSSLTPEQHTRVFLAMLDEEARSKPFCFRVFEDDKRRQRPDLRGNFTGTLKEREQALRERNAAGAGVFVAINEGGHTDREIARVRAVFADTDGAPLQPLLDALSPHIVVCSSPGKYHVYWLVDGSLPVERFKPIQVAIAKKFGTDRSVNNPSRLMRLPGFAHNKAAPFGVRIVSVTQARRYSVEEIVHGLAVQESEHVAADRKPSAPAAVPSELPTLGSYDLSRIEEMLGFINPWCDRDPWRDVIFALAHEYGDDARDLALRWSRGDLWLEPNLVGDAA